jgi:C-terminal processing protease CtpA/Prc
VNHNGCPFLLKQPLIILSSCYTGSAAEDFLIELDQAERAPIVGSASFGSTGQPLFVELESGGGFRICTRNCTYPDGRQFIDIGVQPHVKCELTLDDYKNGVDSVMNKGLEEVRKLINS